MMAMAGKSLSVSLKLFKLPPESIKSETRVPTTPDGVPMLSLVSVSSGLADMVSMGEDNCYISFLFNKHYDKELFSSKTRKYKKYLIYVTLVPSGSPLLA